MDQSKIPTPHNNYFHFAFTDLPNARDLIETQLPSAVLKKIKLDTLAIIPGTFVASDLRDRHADLLLSVELVNTPKRTSKTNDWQRALVYILLEHKSESEKLTVLQLLSYLVRIWEDLVRQGKPLVPIIPLVVYHGERQWKVARRMEELIPVPEGWEDFQVRFGFPLLDLSQLSDEQLPGHKLLQSTLGLLKYSRSTGLSSKLRRILELLADAGSPSVDLWIHTIGVYVMAVNKQIGSDKYLSTVQSVFPTQFEPGSLADRLLIQGREEGREEVKPALIASIHLFQELLQETLTPDTELKTRSVDGLTSVVRELQQRLRDRRLSNG